MLRTIAPLRNDPFFRAFDELLAETDGLLRGPRASRPGPLAQGTVHAARVNGYRAEDAYVLVLEVPGLTADKVEVKVEDGALLVSGEAEWAAPEGARLLHRERADRLRLARRFTFADDADLAGTSAELKDGLLTLRVPRTLPVVRRIEVKAS
ncbi:Hsp20/alpha crystallin family protein [Myxococcota bacterium]|nr:Hsp20/alpha crystallin family protein [Myxococcota bacterium]